MRATSSRLGMVVRSGVRACRTLWMTLLARVLALLAGLGCSGALRTWVVSGRGNREVLCL